MHAPRIALVGFPNAGKSTLFQLLTGKEVARESYPFTTLYPSSAPFSLSDPWLPKLAEIARSERVTHAHFLLYDIPGLIEGAAGGAGLGNQFLAEVRPADFLLFVLRSFVSSEISEAPDPKGEFDLLQTELLLADLQLVERAMQKREKRARIDAAVRKEFEEIAIVREELGEGRKPLHPVKAVPLLSTKPFAVLLNGKEERISFQEASFSLDALFFTELSELPEEEQKSFPESKCFKEKVASLQQHVLNALDLVCFYTITGGKEARAHFVLRQTTFLEAAGEIHKEIQKGFIKALSIPAEKLVALGSWEEARKAGALLTQGREDTVPPNHVIHFAFRAP